LRIETASGGFGTEYYARWDNTSTAYGLHYETSTDGGSWWSNRQNLSAGTSEVLQGVGTGGESFRVRYEDGTVTGDWAEHIV